MKIQIFLIIFVFIGIVSLSANEADIQADVHEQSIDQKNISFGYLNNSFRQQLIESTQKEYSIQQRVYRGQICSGIALISSGVFFGLAGGATYGVSHYLAWLAVAAYIKTTDFTVTNWNKIWQFVFLTADYDEYEYSFWAAFLFAGGLAVMGTGIAMIVPGIILLIFGLINKKNYQKEKVSLLTDAVGIRVRF